MGADIQQSPPFKLALNFHQHIAALPQQIYRNRLVVNMGRGFAITAQLTAQNNLCAGIHASVFQHLPDRMITCHVKCGGHTCLVGAFAYQAKIGTATKGKTQRAMGMKMEQLKAEWSQVEHAHDDH